METRADRDTLHHIANHARTAARRNNGVDARAASHVRSLQFCAHAARPQARNAVAGNRAQRIVDPFHIGDQFSLWVGTRIGGEQPLLVGQQQQFIGSRQNSRQCRGYRYRRL